MKGTQRMAAKYAPWHAACLVDSASFVVGTEASHVINVGVQLLDPNGNNLQQSGAVFAYLSDNADGSTLTATVPSGGVAVGTDGLAVPVVTNKAWHLVSEANGHIDLNITESSLQTYYLVLVMPDGSLVVSAAIHHAG